LLAGLGLWLFVCHKNAEITKALQQSAELKGKVLTLTQESQKRKDLADQAAHKVEDQDKTIATLKTKLSKIKRTEPSTTPNTEPVPAEEMADSLKDQIIDAQDKEIGTLKVEVTELRASLDLKDRALVESERRARGLEIALEAQRSLATSSKWIGRLQGFVIALGTKYVTTKIM